MGKIVKLFFWCISQINKKTFYSNAEIGSGFKCGYTSKCTNESKKSTNIIIGNNVEILGKLKTQDNGKIIIGDNTTIRYGTRIGAVNRIEIGNDVIISNNVLIYDNNNHPVNPQDRKAMTQKGFYGDDWKWNKSISNPVIIEDNVWIGEYATILKGVRVGRGSVVATRAVVTKDVAPFTIVAGNPAKQVKNI